MEAISMLAYLLISLSAVVALFLAAVMLRSKDFRVSRSLEMAAPASHVFEQVDDLHCMNAWNPWLKLDPDVKQRYDGPPSGVGASYSWDGNKHIGAGRQTIIESRPYDLVRIKLEFFRPFACVNEAQFAFVPEGDRTRVTWSMTGELNFMARAMGLFMNMDKMCGSSFEKGLADMKSIVESRISEYLTTV
jgi:hypothetical protein